MKKDYNYIAKVEKAIAKKYGKSAILNPKSNWNSEKEKKYLSEVKEFYSRVNCGPDAKKCLYNLTDHDPCSTCGKEYYFMTLRGEVTYLKWGVCFECFVDHIEGREEKWIKNQHKHKESNFNK